jgi:hypothetical protein
MPGLPPLAACPSKRGALTQRGARARPRTSRRGLEPHRSEAVSILGSRVVRAPTTYRQYSPTHRDRRRSLGCSTNVRWDACEVDARARRESWRSRRPPPVRATRRDHCDCRSGDGQRGSSVLRWLDWIGWGGSGRISFGPAAATIALSRALDHQQSPRCPQASRGDRRRVAHGVPTKSPPSPHR